MTTLQIQFTPHFPTPSTEDPMELTPDTHQRAGGADDIDIDLDLNGDNQQDREDVFMAEEDMNALADSTSAQGPEAHGTNDDEMTDHSYAQGPIDEGSSVHYEDVEDPVYHSPELEDDAVVEPDAGHLNEQHEEQLANDGETIREPNHQQYYQEQERNEQGYPGDPTKLKTESGLVEEAIPNGRTELANSCDVVAKVATDRTPEGQDLAIDKKATLKPDVADQSSRTSNVDGLVAADLKLEQVRDEVLSVSFDPDVEATSNVEESHTRGEDISNSAVHLHPIVLDYQGDEMFLFPPLHQDGEHAATFLLADEKFAYGTIGKLLDACRDVLKESLSEQDELVINILDLNLHISESTVECTSTKLSEVVDLYSHLQQNDGLENPPPLYMDLTTRNRFSCRLDVLRNASIAGTGLSQLKSPQEAETGQRHSFEGETDISNYTTVLSVNEAYASDRQPGDEAEGGSMDQYPSYGHKPPSENAILVADSGAQGTQSYPVENAAREQNHCAGALLGGDSSAHEPDFSENLSGKIAESKQYLEPVQALAGGSELWKAQETLVDDGDFIDYEDVDELKGTSSASSTLQGDAVDTHANQYHAARNDPTVAQSQEHQPPHDIEGDILSDKNRLHEYGDDQKASDIGVFVVEDRPDTAAIPPPCSDDQSQSLSRRFSEKGKALQNNQDSSVSRGTESQLNVNADVQHEASARYEEGAGSHWQETLPEHADQAEGDTGPSADASSQGEVEDYSPRYSLDSEASGSRGAYPDDDPGRVNSLEAENGLGEAVGLLAYDDDGDVPQLLEKVNTRPSLYVDESARTQEEEEEEDDDEITYEDEEYHIDASHEPTQANNAATTSPGSLKRARSLHEDDNDILVDDLQGSKRVRSG